MLGESYFFSKFKMFRKSEVLIHEESTIFESEPVEVPDQIIHDAHLSFTTPFHSDSSVDRVISSKNTSFSCTVIVEEVGDPRDVPIQGVGPMKVQDLQVKDGGELHMVTVWDNACAYSDFHVGHMIRLKDVLTGWNKFHKKNHIIVRYEDQIIYVSTVPVRATIDVKAIGKSKNPDQVHIVGDIDEQCKQLEGSHSMMAKLLDLKDDEAKVSVLMEFVPFKMNSIIQGVKITMMEIPRAVLPTLPNLGTVRDQDGTVVPKTNNGTEGQSNVPNGDRRGILRNEISQENASTSNGNSSAAGTSTERPGTHDGDRKRSNPSGRDSGQSSKSAKVAYPLSQAMKKKDK